ncbi:Protein tyrosine kinase, partial [Rhizoctonia solani]
MPVATVPPFQFPQPTIPNNINQVPEPIETQNLPGDPPSYDAVAGSPSTVSQTSPVLPSFSSQDASAALTVSRSLMTAVNNKADRDEIRRLVLEVIRLAKDENMARRLVDAGVIPHLTIELKNSLPNGQGINNIIFALGLLSHDLLSAASIARPGTARQLIEISKGAQTGPMRACLAWCLGRMIQSDDIAAKFIEEGLSELLISWITVSDDRNTQRYCAWTLGTLARTDALVDQLVEMEAIPVLASHLNIIANPQTQPDPEDLAVALFAVGRFARTTKLSKALTAEGSVEPMVQALKTTIDPKVLNWSARAVGCHMRPNSSDMARVLLRAGAAEGLARLPTVVQAEETDALGSFAFAIARFSCAEWSPGTRKQLVEAGVVDALLRALRAAASVPATDPQVHAELALAISFLGDVGGSSIRKEIQDSGGVDILKQLSIQEPPDVRKACETAIRSTTGNVFSRLGASTKAGLNHDWRGGCPDYSVAHPDFDAWT